MHLGYKTSKYKGKVYKSYSIAESYREKVKVKKRVLWNIGKLTDLQVVQIKKICEVVKDASIVLTSLRNIVVQKCKSFGSILISNALWDEWKLHKAFDKIKTNSDLSTDTIAKLLTINRCIEPCSHYSIPDWIAKTAISEVMNINFERITDDKIYYELDKIAQNHEYIEDHLFRMTWQRNKRDYDYVNYDMTTSYFVGIKCELSGFGVSKDEKPHNKQVVLGVMVNDKGYPFKWDVYHGNTPEIDTLVGVIDACANRFHLKNINIVFDRAFVSDENLEYIDKKKLKYISAMDKDQIANIIGINISIFEDVTTENFRSKMSENEFIYYDDALFYKDLGQINNRRYVLGFNPVLFREERKIRYEKIKYFEEFVKKKNEILKEANRSRKYNPTRQTVIDELKRLKIRKYYEEPILREVHLQIQNKKGKLRIVKTFEIDIHSKNDIIHKAEKLDGLCVFVSNHTEICANEYCFTADKIITAYREKTKIEDAFKHIKSFIKIRPFYVNTNEHVIAVYSISMMAYFINKDLAERRKSIEGIDYLNSKRLYAPFEDYYYTTIKDKSNGTIKNEFMEFTPEINKYIKQMGIILK